MEWDYLKRNPRLKYYREKKSKIDNKILKLYRTF